MRRSLSFFVILVLCIILSSVCIASADDSLYPTSGTCGDNITWEITNNDTTLTISGTGEMYNYEWGNYASYYWASPKLTTVILSEGITSIGDYAFSGFDYITEITLPKTVKSIGTCAFSYSKGITKLTLNEGIERIGGSAFSQCYALETINLPDTLTVLSPNAFQYCYKLKSVTIPNSITSIAESVFYKCTGLESVTLHDKIVSIGNYSFKECSSLASISIPRTLKSIGTYAFDGCASLKAVHITDLAAWCQISFSSTGNPLTYAKNLYLDGELLTELIIPKSVTTIPSSAFSNASSIKSITIHEGVTKIGQNAFLRCSSVEEIIIPFIGESRDAVPTYDNEFNDTLIHLFGYTIEIDETDYSSTTIPLIPETLKKVTITDDAEIGYSAFDGCSNLKTILLPAKLENICDYAFYSCKNLTDVYYMGKEEEWAEITIGKGNTYLSDATIHCLGRDDVEISAEIVDGSINVNLTNAQENDCVIFIFYKAEAFAGVKTIGYAGEQISYSPEVDYDEVKIIVWKSLDSLYPLSDVITL